MFIGWKKNKNKKLKLITAWLSIKFSNYNGCQIISILDLDIFDGEEVWKLQAEQ